MGANQLPYKMFSVRKKQQQQKNGCRLIWLIFHEVYKGGGHWRLFRSFVLSKYATPQSGWAAKCPDEALVEKCFPPIALFVKQEPCTCVAVFFLLSLPHDAARTGQFVSAIVSPS